MNISINANYLGSTRDGGAARECGRLRTIDERIKLCVDAGFKILDYAVCELNDDWKAEIDTITNAAAKYGAVIEQSHAPYNFYAKKPLDVYQKELDRSIEAAIRMGVKYLVFHADEYHAPAGKPYNSNDALNQVYNILSPCIEKTIKGGVKVALETVFEDNTLKPKDGERMHFCGDINELIALTDKFNDPMVGCCWDSGHTKLCAGNDGHVDALRRLGSRIICTHIHDNYYGKDLHLPPFMGDANWEELMPTLKEIGYKGSLTFELVYGNLPNEQISEYLSQLYKTGLLLNKMFEG